MTKSQTSLRKPFLTRDASNEIESCTRVMDVFKDFSNVLKIGKDELRFDGIYTLNQLIPFWKLQKWPIRLNGSG